MIGMFLLIRRVVYFQDALGPSDTFLHSMTTLYFTRRTTTSQSIQNYHLFKLIQINFIFLFWNVAWNRGSIYRCQVQVVIVIEAVILEV
jgi:hypothetical protein